jgi:endonuclease YncB( thermonuclease family)
MLSEIEVAQFRSRIDDLLREGKPTDWQRQFLSDMSTKLGRHGVRTKLSDKQLAILRRLTEVNGSSPQLKVVEDNARPQTYRSSQRGTIGGGPTVGRSPFRRNPLRIRNPLRPRNPFRPRYPLRSRSLTGGKPALLLFAIIMVLGMIGGLLNNGPGTPQNPPNFSSVPDSSKPSTISSKASFSITDGDTIRMTDGTRVRLVGFNTPEKFEPQCSKEAVLGNRASERLKELVATAETTSVMLVACACKPGTQGTRRCNYGRSCGTLAVNGRDVGNTLIAEGLAVPFVCGESGCPRTPRPWCG